MTAEEIAAKLSAQERQAVLDELDCDCDLTVAFDLVGLGVADFETNSDDDLFFWLTSFGQQVRSILEGTSHEQ